MFPFAIYGATHVADFCIYACRLRSLTISPHRCTRSAYLTVALHLRGGWSTIYATYAPTHTTPDCTHTPHAHIACTHAPHCPRDFTCAHSTPVYLPLHTFYGLHAHLRCDYLRYPGCTTLRLRTLLHWIHLHTHRFYYRTLRTTLPRCGFCHLRSPHHTVHTFRSATTFATLLRYTAHTPDFTPTHGVSPAFYLAYSASSTPLRSDCRLLRLQFYVYLSPYRFRAPYAHTRTAHHTLTCVTAFAFRLRLFRWITVYCYCRVPLDYRTPHLRYVVTLHGLYHHHRCRTTAIYVGLFSRCVCSSFWFTIYDSTFVTAFTYTVTFPVVDPHVIWSVHSVTLIPLRFVD